ncbi:MAG: pyruvate dehydrogenase (acetyl-transferring) E1 component subunit alpha [Dehalococcoidia bacterium]|nr:pyruvate dehydrogenase (acetyl-transferring) E1 component subunit alpha [Dehalococcoidia bacterium]
MRQGKSGTLTQRHDGTGLSDEQVIGLLHKMMEIRRFEEKAAEMYARGKIHGFLHLYIGQEGVATGAISALRPDDYIVSHYREHGHALARGLDPKRIMAELFGKETGVTGGRGGSMHLFDVSKSFMGGYAIVAGHMPLACGLALAEQYKGTERIAANFLGDGAVNEGEFHEALNLASVWKLPVLFVVENNFYGMGTAVQRVSATVEVYKRAAAYGIHSEQVDGMDVLATHEAVARLAQRVRSGDGPAFLEAICYRFRGHSMADPEFYRKKEEIERWRALDPIEQMKRRLLADGLISGDDVARMQAEVDRTATEAAEFAEQSAFPSRESLMRDVYADGARGEEAPHA